MRYIMNGRAATEECILKYGSHYKEKFYAITNRGQKFYTKKWCEWIKNTPHFTKEAYRPMTLLTASLANLDIIVGGTFYESTKERYLSFCETYYEE